MPDNSVPSPGPRPVCGSAKRVGRAIGVALCAVGLFAPAQAAEPDSPEVKAAIKRAVDYLGGRLRTGQGNGEHILGALAMVKGGADKSHPAVVSALAAIDRRCQGNRYTPTQYELYTAPMKMMLLEAAGDPATREEKMRLILAYLLAQQQNHGGWFYVDARLYRPNNFGDTSITQYCILGMWTAERAGIEIDPAVWNSVAEWQMKTRRKDDTFTYHPTSTGGGEVRDTMTAAGACNSLLCARYLHGEAAVEAQLDKAAAEARAALQAAEDAKNALLRKYAVLDRRVDPTDPDAGQSSVGPLVPLTKLTDTADGSIETLGQIMQYTNGEHRLYYLYTLERLGALSGRAMFGSRNWYDEGSDFLLETQRPDGAWPQEQPPEVATSFAVMFLSQSTAKALGREQPSYGGGLLKGGRGLPDDFTKARFNGEEITFDRPTGELADLLTQLEDPRSANVPAAREAVLETVRVGDREALIGQTARLRRLVDDPRPEVRAVVAWALARGGGTEDVAALFDLLAEDPDAAVVQEAHNALAVLSRLPRGPGIPLAMLDEREAALERLAGRDLPATYITNKRLRVLPAGPFDGLPAGLPEEERAQAFEDWRGVATAAWSAWRDAVRPYEQRDLTPAPKRP